MTRWLRLLLLFVPLAAAARWLHWGGATVFIFAGLAIVPLAGLMGEATETLATRLGAGVGGLLNATFGNAAELIIGIAALQKGLFEVVKASLTGSILGNVLLVLGASFVAGGVGRVRQTFDRAAAGASATLLALAAVGLLVPALFHRIAENGLRYELPGHLPTQFAERYLSLVIALVLFCTYLLSLLFSLRTHRHLYLGEPVPGERPAGARRVRMAVIQLLASAALVAGMSELLVGAVEEASRALYLSQVFVGVVVVAIVGNAAEHSTAVLMAVRNRMDVSLHIAIGSSTQIALFVAPVLLFLSYLMPAGPMDLRFTMFEVVSVGVGVVVLHMVAADGESNWFEGVLLLAVYFVLAAAFYFLP